MKNITVTVNENNEELVFSLKPLVSFDEFIEAVEMVVSVECLKDGEEMGLWQVM